jgi:hypothetical protein
LERPVPIRVTIAFKPDATVFKVAAAMTDREAAVVIDFREEMIEIRSQAAESFNRETVNFNRADDSRRQRAKVPSLGSAKIKSASFRICK